MGRDRKVVGGVFGVALLLAVLVVMVVVGAGIFAGGSVEMFAHRVVIDSPGVC